MSGNRTANERGCLGTLGVLLAMLAIVGGGAVAAVAVADLPNQPIQVSRGVAIQPPMGWDFVGRTDDGTGILLTSGGASVFVDTVAGTDERAALANLQQEWAQEPALAMGAIEPSEIRPGVVAASFAYSGSVAGIASVIEGEVVGLRGSDYVAIFDGWAGLGEYLLARAEIEAMIREATLP